MLEKERHLATFLAGWLFGTVFFFITCWWLTFAPITYAGFPVIPTYLLLLGATAAAGVFSGFFGLIYGLVRRAFGAAAVLSAPFIWIAFEFARCWLTGNNWNAVGYSQAFNPNLIQNASIGGVALTGFVVVLASALAVFAIESVIDWKSDKASFRPRTLITVFLLLLLPGLSLAPSLLSQKQTDFEGDPVVSEIIAVQPNVPMSGLDFSKWRALRKRQTDLAESELGKIENRERPVTVVLPESPMNFQYALDPEFKDYIDGFARNNQVSVLFNSAEPDPSRERGFFNSAVLVGPDGGMVRQYDKIHLLPFGEFVPLPEFAQGLIPPMVGRFSHGSEYDLFDLGGGKAGVMICFESHFGSLSAEYARNGADLIIEMTNDGYLGPTPVLRQHLANAVFRAVETGRPVLRVTNVGVTAMIDQHGKISDRADTYTEAVRHWPVKKVSRGQTFYVLAGEWFSILCVLVSVGLVVFATVSGRRKRVP
ncbi:MAG: apolipoprotein N-acyltransferase [Acidobacteria bacterium]|nr:MAG: apolipoprotein N-acyltransferase [Acidobacteriota bacterium]REK02662.1 MAG: apolipoprotein N-acyltransferase [Acidobacteriota bacterium]REK13533.1 MAG: apolipoprotein N-acyltransferase [Acidobacteriota bacterium]REK41527.1 MAG: apolipoprotein N-acyltransferase [Acidobacteriota bacterium]